MGRWVEAGLISWPEYFALGAYVGTALDIPDSPYAQSRKEPDFFFRPRLASALPANAFEVGWSESGNGLATDRDLLLRGSGGAIQVVVLINWNVRRQSRTVTGTAEVWRLGPYDQPMLVQSEVCSGLDTIFGGYYNLRPFSQSSLFLTHRTPSDSRLHTATYFHRPSNPAVILTISSTWTWIRSAMRPDIASG